MPDPIQVEQLFRELMEQLESTISIRHRYHLFRSFIDILEGSYSKFESYILQIADELPVFTGPLTWTGIDPSEIEYDLALLDKLESELHLSDKSENFTAVYNRLRVVCILLYGCLNDLKGVNLHIEKTLGMSGMSYPNDVRDTSVLNLLKDWIAKTLQNRKELTRKQNDSLKRMLREVKKIQGTEDWKLLIPVAEKYQSEGIGYGRLRKISVERYSETGNEDELVWNMQVYGAANPSMSEKKNVHIAARNLLESKSGKRNNNYYRGGVNFDFRKAFHVGNSANLAISALWYTHLQEATNQRNRYKINSHSIITGDIDKEGNVLPVDGETIGLKVKAAFFSWGKIFAVPASQRGLFEKELNTLLDKYPTRNIVLYGVSHLRELFFDRRLTEHEEEGRIKYYFKRLKSQEFRFITVPLITVLLGFIMWLIFGPVDKNPNTLQYEGEQMTLMNQYGQKIQSLKVGSVIVEAIQQSQNPIFPYKALLHDLNNDGINELFFSRMLSEQNFNSPEELIAYSVSGDSIIWKKNLSFDLEFPNKPEIQENGYKVYSLNIINSSKDNLIVNIGHGRFFPSIILKLNAETGEESSRYIHSGRIKQTKVVDIDNDGDQEVIGLGQNNAFDEITVFFALEADKIVGYSPSTDEYTVLGYTPAEHEYYVQVPRSIVGQVFKRRVVNNTPEAFFVNSDEELFRVRVNDFRLPENDPFQVNYAALIYMIDYNFRVRSIGTQSYYDLWAKNLYEDGMIPFEPDHEYFEAFKDSLLYWDGQRFKYRSN
ncbi:hypothetical protein [Rhodohalobacter sulfatireducens]|uniref:VCBS repeat-containing protein n=1 Tax=Rhodohalobacter sulfatireducens TaxID=2911366 RepID=A0ABS9KC89_9BACT|nr:hypothetical protein [Rhodohalobacter sulfatireducens]MCG2588464.1 hypothetical protein [Rhodohalobacter sulfatireducens]